MQKPRSGPIENGELPTEAESAEEERRLDAVLSVVPKGTFVLCLGVVGAFVLAWLIFYIFLFLARPPVG